MIMVYNMNFNQNMLHTKYIKFAPVAQLDRALGYGPGGSGFKSYRRTNYMSIFDNKINRVIIFSFFIKLTFVIFYHEKNLSDEWAILFKTFKVLNPIVIMFLTAKPYLVHTCHLYILYLFI